MSALTAALKGAPRAFGLEAALEGAVGLAALSGGLTLMLSPDGSAAGLSLAALARSPFHSYFVPGLLLAIVIGGLNLAAAVLTVRHSALSRAASLVAGAAIVVFIAVEVGMIPGGVLQLIIGAVGITITALAAPPRT
jgi:hypothetical protein